MLESSGEMTPPCGVPAIVRVHCPVLHHACREPLPQQLQHPPVRDRAGGPASAASCGRCCRSSRGCRRPAHGCPRVRRARGASPAPASRSASAETHTTRPGSPPRRWAPARASPPSAPLDLGPSECRAAAVGHRPSGCIAAGPAAVDTCLRATRRRAPARRRSTPRCSIAASVCDRRPPRRDSVFTRRHASRRTSSLQIRSIRAWKRRVGDRLAATHRRRCNWRTLSMGGRPPGELGPVLPAMPSRVLAPTP